MPAMDPHAHRATVRQLADDLSWLEDHCRRQPDLAVHAAHLRLSAALTRNVVGPAADGQPPVPLFVAVVGGAGAGKSTVVNFLCGSVVAEANPQAGYTRHPTAYLPAGLSAPWPAAAGFLGPLQRLTADQPANLDEDVYQVRKLAPAAGPDPLGECVVWDCPDMTAWASAGYVGRLMEVVALADVIVYVASDERYNDEVPTQFLHLLVKAGKAVVVCLTKVRETDAASMTEHFKREVLGQLPTAAGEIPPVPVVVLPQLPADVRSDPAGKGASYRVQLLNQLLALCPSAADARQRTVTNAVRYLETAGHGLLDVARKDLAEIDAWRAAVADGRAVFEQRYRHEFLGGEPFRRFDRTREQVLEMLELSGPGKAVSATLYYLRWPLATLRDLIAKSLTRPLPPSQSEQAVCSAALAAWLDGLQAESLRRAGAHPVWRQIAQAFDAGLKGQAQDRFAHVFRNFELKETDELDQAAKAIPERLANSPALLNTYRLGVVGLDLAAAGAAVYLTWPPNWYLLLAVPAAVFVSRQGAELVVRGAVDRNRNRLRAQREALVAEHLSGPLAGWLADAPVSGGSSLERLQQVLRRVPAAIRELAVAVRPPAPQPAAAA
ncbi:MAG: GTPase domain-containing protein [Gemmataceae bacterium]